MTIPSSYYIELFIARHDAIFDWVLLGTGWMPQSGCGYPLTCSAHSTRALHALQSTEYRVLIKVGTGNEEMGNEEMRK